MGEHLDPDEFPFRPSDPFAYDGLVDFLDLPEVELPGKDYHIGEPGIESQGFGIGDIELGGGMDLKAYASRICDGGHVGGYHSIYPCPESSVQGFPHCRKIFLIEDDVEGKVGLDGVLPAYSYYIGKVVGCEIVCGMGSHVQIPHSEIH